MKKWRVDYAYRKGGEYFEDSVFIEAFHVDGVLYDANAILAGKSIDGGWDEKTENGFIRRYKIGNVGIVCEADEEVF